MPRLRRTLLILVLAALPLAWASLAEAASCSFTVSDVAFGNVDLSTGQVFDTTAIFTANCSGLPHEKVRICPNFGSGTGGNGPGGDPRYMLQGSNALAFQLYSNRGGAKIWGSYLWPYPDQPPTINLNLGPSGMNSSSSVIYGQIMAGQTTLPGGFYSSSFSGINTSIAYADRSLGKCDVISLGSSVQVPFNVTATNAAGCTVSATDMNFGTHGVLAASIYANTTISVTCPSGVSYAIGLDGGVSGATDPTQRHMTQAGSFITYGIYSDVAYTQPWGNTVGTDTRSGIGTGVQQTFTGYGRVLPQNTPPPNTYNDIVVVTVTY